MLDKWRSISATTYWSRIVGRLYPEPTVETELPESLRAEILPTLRPEAVRLEEQRRKTVDQIDQRARWMVPIGVSPLLLALIPGMGLGLPVIMAVAGGLLAWGAAARGPAAQWQKQMREGFGKTLAKRLSGFDHTAFAKPDRERLEALHLFGKVISVEVADRINGHREGRDLALSTMRIKYSARAKPLAGKRDKPILYCDMVEVETKAEDAPLIIGVGKSAYDVLRDTPEQVHKLTRLDLDDHSFAQKFHLFSSDPESAKQFLHDDLRTALVTICERHGNDPPHFVIMPRYMAVLFPRLTLPKVFRSRPYWIPVDAERTLAQFASDLAERNAIINNVLSLPVG